MNTRRLVFSLLLFFCCLLRLPAVESTPAPLPPSEWQSVIEQFGSDAETVETFWDIPASTLCAGKKQAFLRQWWERLQKTDITPLSPSARVDYVQLRRLLQYELRNLERATAREAEVLTLLPSLRIVVALAEDQLQKKPLTARTAAGQLAEIARLANAAAIDKTPADTLNRAVGLTRRLQRRLQEWHGFYNGYDPLYTWWAAAPYAKADQALGRLVKEMEQRLAAVGGDFPGGPIPAAPVGREALVEDLALAMIPYTPEELIEIGRQEMAWCETEMIRAARDMGCGDDWRRALEMVKNDFVEPGGQVELVRALGEEAIAYMEDNNLITVPPLAKETWRIDMLTPRQQLINPFLTGGREVSVSSPTAEMEHEQKWMGLRGNNRHFTRAVVHHELIPGHFLQHFMDKRHRSYRRIFDTPFWVEGWPLYWEMQLWDRDFAHTPQERMGMLFWRMHRCARIVFSLSFHLGKMSVRECVDMLVQRVGHEPANAAAEVRRSFTTFYPPLYQCAYLLGGLQLRELARELVGGGTMTLRQFHDRVIMENCMPIELLRLYLTGREIVADPRPAWRFHRPPGTR